MIKEIKFLLMKFTTILFAILVLISNTLLFAQQSDNGDGTYTNPLIFADFPDPDVIRIDTTYYMVTTTMFVFPGVTILKSYDLVNWEYCSNAVERMDYSPCYNLDGCNRYSHGQWATSMRYYNGKCYLIFITLDEGGFVCEATNPEGPWELKALPRGFYDPGLFFDDDDRIYVAHGYSDIYITELNSDFVAIDNDVHVFTGDIRPGLEGSHVYKINGYYYLYATYGGGDGFQVALRSETIYGPYEQKIVIQDNGNLGTGLHQGALIQTQKGDWWTIIFQDGGAFGRFPTLQPVTWEDDWPMVGVDGKGVDTYPKPDVGRKYPISILPTSDEFESDELGMQWGWNHNPDSIKWSLTAKPGYLRLKTVKPVTSLPEAQNTLTQRIFAYYSNTVASTGAVRMNTDNMKDGDIAGIAVFQDPYAYLGVKQVNGAKYLVMVNNGNAIDSIATDSTEFYLRAHADYKTSKATFAYSYDNQSYSLLGNDLAMRFNLSVFTGNKFCIFNYATVDTGGFVDFDWFRTDSCGKSAAMYHLRVNDGIVMNTNEVTVNAGDKVTLIPEADADGTWIWSGCGVSGNTNSVFVYPVNSCVVYGTFTNACGAKSNLRYQINVNPSSIEERNNDNPDIVIIPNPVRSELRVLWEPAFNKLAIYSLDGKQIANYSYKNPLSSVSFSLSLDSGIYLLVLANNKTSATTKLSYW